MSTSSTVACNRHRKTKSWFLTEGCERADAQRQHVTTADAGLGLIMLHSHMLLLWEVLRSSQTAASNCQVISTWCQSYQPSSHYYSFCPSRLLALWQAVVQTTEVTVSPVFVQNNSKEEAKVVVIMVLSCVSQRDTFIMENNAQSAWCYFWLHSLRFLVDLCAVP